MSRSDKPPVSADGVVRYDVSTLLGIRQALLDSNGLSKPEGAAIPADIDVLLALDPRLMGTPTRLSLPVVS